MDLRIRPCTEHDIAQFAPLQPEGWQPIEPMFRFFRYQPFCFPHIAELDGKIVATSNGIQNEKSAWLSHIIVAPGYRRMGIGTQVTDSILKYMQGRANKSILLIATEFGEHLYPKLGFIKVGLYNFYTGDNHLSHAPDKIVVPQANRVVNEYLRSLGYEFLSSAPRMALQKDVRWKPRMLFSRVGGWYG